MIEDPIREALRAPERPVKPDPEFAEELFERLRREMGHRARPFLVRRPRRIASPALRRALIAAAVLLVTFAVLAAILWPLRGWLVDRSQPVNPPAPVVNGRLVLSRAGQIVTMEPDGTDDVLLTDTGSDFYPAWSPDSQRIAFVRESEGSSALWLIDADGTGEMEVADGYWLQPPIWSPDGRYIAYTEILNSNATRRTIWRVTPDGQERVQLTVDGGMNALRDWSPDGAKIAFESDRDGQTDIWIMNADGSGAVNLTPGPVTEWGPTFSPDGSRIAFYRGSGPRRHGGYSKTAIWTMNPDGTEPVRLTDGKSNDISPKWSPDGRWIAFRRDRLPRGADYSIAAVYRIAPAGSMLQSLTDRDVSTMDFNWSPDSMKLVVVDEGDRIDDGILRIGIVGVDGTGFQLVSDQSGTIAPDWQAIG